MKVNGFNDKQKQELAEIVGSAVDNRLESKLKSELKPIHKKLDKLQKDLSTTIRFFDNVTIDHAKRLEKVEIGRFGFAN